LTTALLFLLAGLVLITLGGEAIVTGAGRIAKALGVPAVVIALTLVAFGTSFPEMAVNVTAAMRDATDLAIGNIIGSNIANILLVLGLASMVRPLAVHLDLIRRESPFLVLLQVGLLLMVMDGQLGWIDGSVLLGLGLAYLTLLVRAARRARLRSRDDPERAHARRKNPIWLSAIITIAGFAMLFFGARWFVRGALDLVELFGLSQRVVGLTVAAIGTSLPEIASSTMAAWRRQADLAVGNAVGSCIFNLVFVLGITSIIHPIPVSLDFATGMGVDMGVAIVASVVLLPILWTGHRIVRAEGAALLASYAAYMVWLIVFQA
jgi:cation:H+ antiporter